MILLFLLNDFLGYVLRGERKLLERSFPFPTPLSFKNFETWGLIFFAVIPALNGRTHYVRNSPKCESF